MGEEKDGNVEGEEGRKRENAIRSDRGEVEGRLGKRSTRLRRKKNGRKEGEKDSRRSGEGKE